MTIVHHHRKIINGSARGPLAAIERAALRLAEVPYRLAVQARNRAFDRKPDTIRRLDVPVISIGNITTGGTGKTPLVIWLGLRLAENGRKPAILSRGYKAEAGSTNDEARLIARHLPEIPHICMADRGTAGRHAVEHHGADTLLLDDGFQHRRLHRDFDIVLLDATCPFGFNHLLPRGLLREPPGSLQRADILVITRADQVPAAQLEALTSRLAEIAPAGPVVRCVHHPGPLVDLDGRPLADLDPRAERVILFSAIGNPAAFSRGAQQVGIAAVAEHAWPDHHRYTSADARYLCDQVAAHDATVLLTTEKDAVKLQDLSADWPCRVAAQPVAIQFLDEGERVLLDAVDRALRAAQSDDSRR